MLTDTHDANINLLAPYTIDLWKCIQPKSHLSSEKTPKELDREILKQGTKAFVNKKPLC